MTIFATFQKKCVRFEPIPQVLFYFLHKKKKHRLFESVHHYPLLISVSPVPEHSHVHQQSAPIDPFLRSKFFIAENVLNNSSVPLTVPVNCANEPIYTHKDPRTGSPRWTACIINVINSTSAYHFIVPICLVKRQIKYLIH